MKKLYSNIFCILGFPFGYSLHVVNYGSLFTLCCCYKKDINLTVKFKGTSKVYVIFSKLKYLSILKVQYSGECFVDF